MTDRSDILFPEDLCRSVVQCACGAATPWRGYHAACAEGWCPSSRAVRDKLERVWTCPDCAGRAETPLPGGEAPSSYVVPEELFACAITQSQRRRAEAERLLKGLAAADPPRFQAFITQILEAAERAGGKIAVQWRKFARARKTPMRKPRRAARVHRKEETNSE